MQSHSVFRPLYRLGHVSAVAPMGHFAFLSRTNCPYSKSHRAHRLVANFLEAKIMISLSSHESPVNNCSGYTPTTSASQNPQTTMVLSRLEVRQPLPLEVIGASRPFTLFVPNRQTAR